MRDNRSGTAGSKPKPISRRRNYKSKGKPIARRRFHTPEPTLAARAALASQSRGHGGASGPLIPGRRTRPGQFYPGVNMRNKGRRQSFGSQLKGVGVWGYKGFTGALEDYQHPGRVTEELTGINPKHPLSHGPYWLAGNVALSGLPFLRGPRALAAGLSASREGRSAAEAMQASMRARGPISQAAAKARASRRTRKVAGKGVSYEPASRSRIGRVIERGADALRPVTSKLTLGVVKSPERKAGEEFGRTMGYRRKMRESLAHALGHLRLSAPMEYALRIINEGVTPEQRFQHHVRLASEAGMPEQAVYHNLHADLIRKAEQFIDVVNGVPVLKADAPENLRAAQQLLERSTQTRETLYRQMGLLQDEQIAARVHAPGRVFHGARYSTTEEQIDNAIESNEQLREFFRAIDQHFADDPVQARAIKSLVTANVRRHAQEIGDPVNGINDAMSSLYGIEGTAPPATRAIHPDDLPDDMGVLYQGEQLDMSTMDLPRTIRGTKQEKALYNLIKLGAPYRDWYKRAAGHVRLVAQQEGVTFDQMAQVVGITSQQAMPTLNLKRAIQAVQDFKQNGRVTIKLLPGQADKIEHVLKGGQWSGRKTNSFYMNIVGDTDHVTVDRHIARQMFGVEFPNKQQYDQAEALYRGLAKKLGWTPKEVQAAAWVPIKAESMRQSVARRGWQAKDVSAYFASAADAYERAYKRYVQGSLFQGDPEGFARAVKQLFGEYEAFARDIAQTLPEEEWPTWMKNIIRHQAVGAEPPIRLPEATSPMDQTLGPTSLGRAYNARQDLLGNGGFTLNPDLSPHTEGGYAVGVYPEAERTMPIEAVTADDILRYRDDHKEIFARDPQAKVGGWVDQGKAVFDISRVYDNLPEAQVAGREAGQKMIYDMNEMRDIPVAEQLEQAGTGSNFRAGPGLPGWEKPYTDADQILRNTMHRHYGLNKDIGAEVFTRKTKDEIARAFVEARKSGGMGAVESGLFAAMRVAREVGDHATHDRIWNHLKDRNPHWLTQLSHEVGGEGPYGIKGAITFPDATGAIIHLTQHADTSTVMHEWAHYTHAFLLGDSDMAAINRALKAPRDATFDELSRAQKEQWARWFESYIRHNTSPNPKITRALESASAQLRKIYDDADLPTVPKDVARVIDDLFRYKVQPGGKLLGAEDVKVGVNYIPYNRGVPASWSEPAQSFSAYVNYVLHGRLEGAGGERSLFARPRGKGSAIGGPSDDALKKSYKGSGLISGMFDFRASKPSAKSLITASRISAAHDARAGLVEMGNDLPQTIYDIPVKVDPTKTTSPELRMLQERMQAAEVGGRPITEKELEGIDFDLIERGRQDVFPPTIDGRSPREVAAELLTTNEPIDNIVWVDPMFLDASGLLDVPGAQRIYRMGIGKKGLLGAVDGFNDIQRALILYLSPAYAPVNLVGNLWMNLVQQGPFMLPNLYRASTLHRDLDLIHRVFIDGQMGHGLIGSLQMAQRGPIKSLTQPIAHMIGNAVDLMPRRAAWLHEARRYGLKDPEELRSLIDRALDADQEAMDTVEMISRRANDAIVDYERLSPFERNVMARVIFFYPWLKGATRWSLRFVAEHPIQALAFALAYEHAQENSKHILAEKPYYAKEVIPLATSSVGLRLPGVGDVGLDQFVGEHQWKENVPGVGELPMGMNIRQIFTTTTPMELYESAYGWITGKPNLPEAVENLTPLPYSLGVSLFGYDPFAHKEVPRGLKTFLDQAYGNIPVVSRLHAINMSDEERKKYQQKALQPRNKREEVERTFGGALAPAPYNPKIGAQRVAQETQTTFERHRNELIADSKHFGMGEPPQEVIDELEWKAKWDHIIASHRGGSYKDKLPDVAKLYDEKHGGNDGAQWVKYAQTERKARYYYERIRDRMWPQYRRWQAIIDARTDREVERQG